MNVTPAPLPTNATSITVPSPLCVGSTVTFTTPAIANATSYVWTVAGTGWSGSSTTNSISVTVGTGTGTITVAGLKRLRYRRVFYTEYPGAYSCTYSELYY